MLVTINRVADWKRGLRRVVYPVYEARVLRRMPNNLPKHVGVMLDGNRRWAKAVGADTAHGYQAGADNIEPFLGWCEEVGVQVVTLWLLSSDNITQRPAEQLTGLLGIIEGAVESLAEAGRGLQMICAFSDLWGYTTPSEAGKVVWAMFTARHAPPSPARNRGRPARDPMPGTAR